MQIIDCKKDKSADSLFTANLPRNGSLKRNVTNRAASLPVSRYGASKETKMCNVETFVYKGRNSPAAARSIYCK